MKEGWGVCEREEALLQDKAGGEFRNGRVNTRDNEWGAESEFWGGVRQQSWHHQMMTGSIMMTRKR